MARGQGREPGSDRGLDSGGAAGCNRECDKAGSCTLAGLRRGGRCVVLGIDDDDARAQATRFGMSAGATVSCVTTLPAGPVILRSGRQEIAVGRGLARRIRVRHLTAGEVA